VQHGTLHGAIKLDALLAGGQTDKSTAVQEAKAAHCQPTVTPRF
jgi:hypothetical protein